MLSKTNTKQDLETTKTEKDDKTSFEKMLENLDPVWVNLLKNPAPNRKIEDYE